MNRFFVPKENITGRRIRVTDKEDVHHAAHVLRMREGERCEVSDGESMEYVCEVESVDAEELSLRILDEGPFRAEPRVRVTLFQGYPKADKLEQIVQKTTELGVSAVVPVYTARSVVRDSGKKERKRERLRKIAESAAKQSKRGIVPQVAEACVYGAVSGLSGDFDLVLIPYEEEQATTLKAALRAFRNARKELFKGDGTPAREIRVAVLIGPEGGFEPSEVKAAEAQGAVPVTLGGTILRTETAGPATVAMILYELEMKEPDSTRTAAKSG